MMQEGFGGRKNDKDKENIQQGLGARKSLQPDAAASVLRKKSSQRDAAARIWRKKSSQRDGAEQFFAGYVQGIIHYITKTWSRVEQLSPCLPIFHCVVQTHRGQPAKPITNSNKQTQKKKNEKENKNKKIGMVPIC
jgi:hypothetical protein